MKNIVLFIMIALMFSACEYEKKIIPSGNVVEVGVLAPLSGKDKRLGHQSLLGLQAANEMQPYLSNGDEIVFKIIDTKSDIKSARGALKSLSSKKLLSAFSFMSSKEMTALSKQIDKRKLPIITTLATDNHIAKESSYIAQVCIDNSTQVLVASHYIKDEKFIKNVGVIYNKKNQYSLVLAKEFRKYFTQLGGNIKFFIDVSTRHGLGKFQKYKKKNIEMLFNTADAKITTKILKILKDEKSDFYILGTDGLLSGALELPSEDLKLFDTLHVVEHYAHNTKRNKYRKKFESILDKNSYAESSYAFLAYDGYQLLRYALNSCPQYDTTCIKHSLQNSPIIEGISNNFTMINAKVKREVYVDKITNAKLEKEVVVY